MCDSRTLALPRDERVLTASRDPSRNAEDVLSRVSAALKRVAPLMADATLTEHGSKHRRTNSCTPRGGGGGSGDGDACRRRVFFGNDNSTISGNHSDIDIDEDDPRLVQETVSRIALETEKVRASRERAASFAAADRDLDDAFLASFGVSLTMGSGAGSGGRQLPTVPATDAPFFDRTRITSLPLGGTEAGRIEPVAEKQDYRRQRAEATLSAAEFECWLVREEIDGYRRQEEKMRSEIFNGDPLLPLGIGAGAGSEASPS